ncbi:MAG TPA: ATP-binding cassette domain-containing protein [Pirellulaceae bacterium]|nr:ATP-binding cassette domain-containing protein [Pirellulaceae bacterium]HMO93913.1 ATP-binding cassette domain-containing protein [Pirellulaceae bacterium]HMP68951.1 ATP-binding cassette domain-containing protein [Pirellulaceae bacterium]
MNLKLSAQFKKHFAANTIIEAHLEVPIGQFSTTVLFGPSGCGKTTVLRALAGLERPEFGTIQFAEEIWLDAARSICRSPQARGIGFCFQESALFPHLNLSQNIGYSLGRKHPEYQQTVNEMLDRFQLTGLGDRYPHQVSGGQQRRIALARVLARRPRLLLLDEPFSALDTALRLELHAELKELLGRFQIPVLLVTHDRQEAATLADQLIIMDEGQIQQSGSVQEVFENPANGEVARIVGTEKAI